MSFPRKKPVKKTKRSFKSLVIRETKDEVNARRKFASQFQKEIKAQTLLCTACNVDLSQFLKDNVEIPMHPFLKVPFCYECQAFYNSGDFSSGTDGDEKYCRWCGQGGSMYICSKCVCGFCSVCIKNNLGEKEYKKVSKVDQWLCYFCQPQPLWPIRYKYSRIIADGKKKDSKTDALNSSKSSGKQKATKRTLDSSSCSIKAKRPKLETSSKSSSHDDSDSEQEKKNTSGRAVKSKRARNGPIRKSKSSDDSDSEREKKNRSSRSVKTKAKSAKKEVKTKSSSEDEDLLGKKNNSRRSVKSKSAKRVISSKSMSTPEEDSDSESESSSLRSVKEKRVKKKAVGRNSKSKASSEDNSDSEHEKKNSSRRPTRGKNAKKEVSKSKSASEDSESDHERKNSSRHSVKAKSAKKRPGNRFESSDDDKSEINKKTARRNKRKSTTCSEESKKTSRKNTSDSDSSEDDRRSIKKNDRSTSMKNGRRSVGSRGNDSGQTQRSSNGRYSRSKHSRSVRQVTSEDESSTEFESEDDSKKKKAKVSKRAKSESSGSESSDDSIIVVHSKRSKTQDRYKSKSSDGGSQWQSKKKRSSSPPIIESFRPDIEASTALVDFMYITLSPCVDKVKNIRDAGMKIFDAASEGIFIKRMKNLDDVILLLENTVKEAKIMRRDVHILESPDVIVERSLRERSVLDRRLSSPKKINLAPKIIEKQIPPIVPSISSTVSEDSLKLMTENEKKQEKLSPRTIVSANQEKKPPTPSKEKPDKFDKGKIVAEPRLKTAKGETIDIDMSQHVSAEHEHAKGASSIQGNMPSENNDNVKKNREEKISKNDEKNSPQTGNADHIPTDKNLKGDVISADDAARSDDASKDKGTTSNADTALSANDHDDKNLAESNLESLTAESCNEIDDSFQAGTGVVKEISMDNGNVVEDSPLDSQDEAADGNIESLLVLNSFSLADLKESNVAENEKMEVENVEKSSVSGTKDHESSPSGTKDHESSPPGTNDHESSTPSAKNHESSPLDSKDHESSPLGTNDHESSAPGTKDHESSPPSAKDHESSLPGTKDHESSAPGTTDHESSPPIVKDHESSLPGTNDHEISPSGTKDHESSQPDTNDHESSPSGSKDDQHESEIQTRNSQQDAARSTADMNIEKRMDLDAEPEVTATDDRPEISPTTDENKEINNDRTEESLEIVGESHSVPLKSSKGTEENKEKETNEDTQNEEAMEIDEENIDCQDNIFKSPCKTTPCSGDMEISDVAGNDDEKTVDEECNMETAPQNESNPDTNEVNTDDCENRGKGTNDDTRNEEAMEVDQEVDSQENISKSPTKTTPSSPDLEKNDFTAKDNKNKDEDNITETSQSENNPDNDGVNSRAEKNKNVEESVPPSENLSNQAQGEETEKSQMPDNSDKSAPKTQNEESKIHTGDVAGDNKQVDAENMETTESLQNVQEPPMDTLPSNNVVDPKDESKSIQRGEPESKVTEILATDDEENSSSGNKVKEGGAIETPGCKNNVVLETAMNVDSNLEEENNEDRTAEKGFCDKEPEGAVQDNEISTGLENTGKDIEVSTVLENSGKDNEVSTGLENSAENNEISTDLENSSKDNVVITGVENSEEKNEESTGPRNSGEPPTSTSDNIDGTQESDTRIESTEKNQVADTCTESAKKNSDDVEKNCEPENSAAQDRQENFRAEICEIAAADSSITEEAKNAEVPAAGAENTMWENSPLKTSSVISESNASYNQDTDCDSDRDAQNISRTYSAENVSKFVAMLGSTPKNADEFVDHDSDESMSLDTAIDECIMLLGKPVS